MIWYQLRTISKCIFKSYNFCFLVIVLFKITMGKGICHIYKYGKSNCPYPPPNTNVVIPQRSDTYIQSRRNSAYVAYVGAHDVALAGLDQSTNHNGNTEVKDNNDSHSFETPRVKIAGFLLCLIHSPQQPHHIHSQCLHLENNIYVFKHRVRLSGHHNVLNQEH